MPQMHIHSALNMSKSSVTANTVDRYPPYFVVSSSYLLRSAAHSWTSFFLLCIKIWKTIYRWLCLSWIFLVQDIFWGKLKEKTVCIRTARLWHMLAFVLLERKEQYGLQSHLPMGGGDNSAAARVKISTSARVCVCAQGSPLPSWCCWPAWTPAPTRGSTRPSPAAYPESCRTCCTAGQGLAAAAPYLTIPPPRTPPPPRTVCTDKDW